MPALVTSLTHLAAYETIGGKATSGGCRGQRQLQRVQYAYFELHLRSDRTAIAYRSWLRELGLSFGTA